MKSIKTISLSLLSLVVVGSQLNAMNIPTKVGPHATFIARITPKRQPVNFFAPVVNVEPAINVEDPYAIATQQELLDQSAGLPAQEVVASVSFAQRAQQFAKNAFNAASEKAQTFKTAVAEKAKNAYNSEMVQKGFAKLANVHEFAVTQGKVVAAKVSEKATQAMEFVKENPKLVAGVAAGLIATYGVYKVVTDLLKQRDSDVVVDEKKEQHFSELTPEEAQKLIGMGNGMEESIIDPEHAAQMEANRQ
ncbi:MAG: hypothetical protein ACOYT8_02675 [Candidatus Dependentiae bacterium]